MQFKACVKWKVKLYCSGQKTRAKKKLQKSFEKRARKTLVLKDENVFVYGPTQVSETTYFYALTSEEVKYDQKSLLKTKFFKQCLIWLAQNVLGSLWGKMKMSITCQTLMV